MAIGAIVAGGKALAKKAKKKAKASKAAPREAALAAKREQNFKRFDETGRSATTVAQELNRGIKEFRDTSAAVTRSSDRRLARQGAAATGAAVAGGAAGSRKAKTKTADPVASRSRTNLQRGR